MQEEDGHRIFVGNLSNSIQDWELEEAFSEYGPTFNVNIPRRGFGFVSYYSKENAENAIDEMNGRYLDDRPIRVEWAWGWPKDSSEDEEDESEENDYETVFNQTSSNNRTVYCGGLIGPISERLIDGIFSQYGRIEEISVFDDRNYAFIHFSTKEAATLAICEVNDSILINGEHVRCSWSHRPNYHIDPNEFVVTDSDSSPESTRSPSPAFDNFETILNQTTPDNCTVYCGGLEGYITEEVIESVFSPYGEINQISLYTERSDYAFIRFSTKISAALAICAVNGTEINGETVICSWSHRPNYHSPVEESPAALPSQPAAAALPSQPAAAALPSQPEAAAASSSSSLPAGESQGAAKAKEKKPDLLCKICMDEDLGVVFLPCGHLASCARCAKKIYNCPMCRKRITGKVRTYLS